MVDDEACLSSEAFDDYLVAKFVPYVTSLYDSTVKAHTSFEEVFKLLLEAIIKLELRKEQVGVICIFWRFG